MSTNSTNPSTHKKSYTVVSVSHQGSEDGSEEDSEEDEYDKYSDKAWLFNSMKGCVSQIEEEMDLEDGTLQKCIMILSNETELDDEKPCSTDHIVQIYSPTAPMYIDVHFQYYCHSCWSEVEWFYSLGYKIHCCPSATASNALSIKQGLKVGYPADVHTCNRWQTLCWGYYDDSDRNYSKNWQCIECGQVELHEEGVVDIHKALFGELEKPTEMDSEAMLAY
ncbi:hypothetical protein BDR04DRAFT_1117254 [Suillus decipiens]|nr:hypothetical protein BDR04DRAFT_1117254 [Suillus decipiens]